VPDGYHLQMIDTTEKMVAPGATQLFVGSELVSGTGTTVLPCVHLDVVFPEILEAL